jgi:voltage-gated potassium channel Kch
MPEKPRHWLSQHRFLVLLISLLLLGVLLPLFEELDLVWAKICLNVLFALILLSSVYAISENKKLGFITLCLTVVALGARYAVDFIPEPSKGLIVAALFLLVVCLFLISTVILIEVFKPGRVTGEKISAAICVYLLIGFLWALLFTLVFVLDPQSFAIEGATLAHFIYYSYVTLTTLGYGDIAPLSPVGKSLAYVEAVIGQIYLTVLIARLVALHIAHGQKE